LTKNCPRITLPHEEYVLEKERQDHVILRVIEGKNKNYSNHFLSAVSTFIHGKEIFIPDN
jgi:hypothetical protein